MLKTKFRIAGLLAAGAASLALAACGSSSGGSNTKHASSSTPTTTASNASATSTMVKTAKGSLGTYLVGPNGCALYLWVADSMNKSVCSGACAKA